MYLMQVTLFALLLMMSFSEQQQVGVEDMPSDFENAPCKEDLNSKITTTSERKRSLREKRGEIEGLRGQLSIAIEEGNVLENRVKNLTTEIEEMEATCPGFLPEDCCQVYLYVTYMYTWIAFN